MLDICVGILKEFEAVGEEEGREYYTDLFAAVNQALVKEKLPEHSEPVDLKETWSGRVRFSQIHYLRRFAAHLVIKGKIPQPTAAEATDDPVVIEYYDKFGELAVKNRFDHLILHSDCEGFYLPIDFNEVVFAAEELEIPGDMIGSAVRLNEECKVLAGYLGLPLDLDPDSDTVLKALENPDRSIQWQKYIAESYVCLVFYHASLKSIALGAAIVFQ